LDSALCRFLKFYVDKGRSLSYYALGDAAINFPMVIFTLQS
jgi:hypothetical protein